MFRDSECRRLWLVWLERLVRSWQSRVEILGWEIFSELDLVTGATEDAAVEFIRRAAGVVRVTDGARRPVTASLSGIGDRRQPCDVGRHGVRRDEWTHALVGRRL